MDYYIYILRLVQNKFYIGRTKNPYFRIDNHFNHFGSQWTTKFPPIEVIEILKCRDSYMEDQYTIKYMNEYGIENVRGGTFSKINLSSFEIQLIIKMIRSQNDLCFKCGFKGHFSNECISKLKEIICFKCGKKGHVSTSCFLDSNQNNLSQKSIYDKNKNNDLNNPFQNNDLNKPFQNNDLNNPFQNKNAHCIQTVNNQNLEYNGCIIS